MRPDSSKEYEFMRYEMESLKSCITTYVGFVIGGVGAAIFGFAKDTPVPNNFGAIVYSALALALIIDLVLSVLMYKFHSHNRYTGYCAALNHERFTSIADPRAV